MKSTKPLIPLSRALVAALIFCGAASALAGGKETPATGPNLQHLTPEQAEVLRQALNLPAGTMVEVEFKSSDGGTLKVTQEAEGKGAAALVEGDKLSADFDGSAPKVNLPEGGSAEGGGATQKAKADAVKIPPVPWQNPLFWCGVACLAGAGFCVWARLRRGATICGVAGVGLLAAAFYPSLMLFAVAGVAAVFLIGQVKAEADAGVWDAMIGKIGRGVDSKSLPENVRNQVKAAIGENMTKAEALKLEQLLQRKGIGKYAAK